MSYNFSICLTQIEKCDKILHCLGAKVPLFKMSVVFMNIWLVSRSKNLALIHKPVFRSTVYSSHTERSYQISCLRYLQFNRKLISERSRTRNPSRFPQLWKTARNKLNKSYLGKLPKISRGGGAQNREAFGRKWVPPLSGATDYTPQVQMRQTLPPLPPSFGCDGLHPLPHQKVHTCFVMFITFHINRK